MELYLIQLINKESSSGRCAKRSRRQTKLINVHVDNLRNRPLSDDDMEAITACIPELYRHIHQETDLSSPTLVEKQLLRPPKDFTAVPSPPPVCRCCGITWAVFPPPPPEKPPAVMATTDTVLFQVFSRSLVTPPHPENLTPPFRWNRWNARNHYDHVEVNGQRLHRVTSGVETTWEKGGRVLHRQWRVTVYRTDGQMMLSVFCSFPEDRVRRRIVFSDGALSPRTTQKRKIDVETMGRSPPRSKTCLRL